MSEENEFGPVNLNEVEPDPIRKNPRIAELEAENKKQGYEIARMKHPAEQYDRLADYVLANGLWRGHEGSHVDSVILRIEAIEAERDRLRAQYNELLFAVVMKHPGETRYQTALRYIQQAENQDNPPSCAELEPLP